MEKACPRCEKLIDAADSICDACGMEFPAERTPRCPGCMRPVKPGSEMCGYCGLELETKPVKDPIGRSSFSISLSSLLLPLIALLVIGAWIRGRKTPDKPQVRSVQNQPVDTRDDGPYEDSAEPSTAHLKPAGVKIPGGFQVEGALFDIMTLKPVMSPTVVFHNPSTNEYIGAFADEKGRYTAWLKPVTAGYLVTVRHKNYHEIYAMDWTPSIRELSAPERRFVMRDLLNNPPKPEHIYGLADAKLKKDFALLPLMDASGGP